MRAARRAMPILTGLVAGTLAGCASRPAPPIAVQTPPPPVALAVPLPSGATPGMLVPERQADGSFPTPNRGLAGAAATWHLRAGLNVAALSCPGTEGAAIRAGYNEWLRRDRASLARVATSYAASYRGTGGGGYDEAMTRLYNFFSQTPVRPAFCTAAAAIVADLASVDAAAQPGFADARLAMLDRPFVDFYAAYDAWRAGAARIEVAAAPAPSAPVALAAMVPPRTAPSPRRPALTLDLAALPADTGVTAAR